MLKPVRTAPPGEPPISLEECKAHLRVDHDDDDALIGGYLASAVARLDGYSGILGRCMVTQTWRQAFQCWPYGRLMRLPFPDVSAITALTYFDEDNVEQTVSASLYERAEDEIGSFIWFKEAFTAPSHTTDRPDPIRVTFEAGYGDNSKVPEAIKQALLLLVGDFYEHREQTAIGVGLDVRPLPLAADNLIEPYRRVGL